MIWSLKQRTVVEIELEREQLEKLLHGEDIRDWINVDLDGIDGPVDLHMYCSNPIRKMPLPETA